VSGTIWKSRAFVTLCFPDVEPSVPHRACARTDLRHQYPRGGSGRARVVDTAHLLFAALADERIRGVLELAGTDLAKLEGALDQHLRARMAYPGNAPELARSFQLMVESAAQHALVVRRDRVGALDLLGALCRAGDAILSDLLSRQGVGPTDVLIALCHGLGPSEAIAKMTPAIPMGADDRWSVTFLNDEYTTQAFVFRLLQEIFELSPDAAKTTMMAVHENGRGEIGAFPARDAARRVARTLELARAAHMPLLATVSRVAAIYR
jgi:ATP-dependent Clp protease adapter protein ClpS